MTVYKYILLACLTPLLFACRSSSSANLDVTGNYVLITTAIRYGKASRLQFQDRFAVALDSFLVNDNPLIALDEQKQLLETARLENKKAEAMVMAAQEVESTLRYKEKTLALLRFLDDQYSNAYPRIIQIMESHAINKKALITEILVPSADSLKQKGMDVVETAKAVAKKYDIKLVEVAP